MQLHHWQQLTMVLLFWLLCVVSSEEAASSLPVRRPPAPPTTMQLQQFTSLQLGVERLAARLRPTRPVALVDLLPASRPVQPWPYRRLEEVLSAGVVTTDSHALLASVAHAPLPGITSEMLHWWLGNIEGQAVYAGDGRVWPKYLMWHPRDHVSQRQTMLRGTSSVSPTGKQQHQQAQQLWEICEVFGCREPGGYTTANYHQHDDHLGDFTVRAVTELQHLRPHSMVLTIPAPLGLGSSFWRLQHTWADSPHGLLVNSSQAVGVVDPGWRPLPYARVRNALMRGLFGGGRAPVGMLQQWLQHCVEEFGNLPHILPSLYAASQLGTAPDPSQAAAADAEMQQQQQQGHAGADEL